MKKSIFIGALALITLAACQNESTEMINSDLKISEKTEAKSAENDPMYGIGYNPEKRMIYYCGKWDNALTGELAEAVIEAAKNTKSKTSNVSKLLPYSTNIRCSGGTEDGYNWYVVHVYGPGYSGDFLVTNYGSAWDTKEITFAAVNCALYHAVTFLWPTPMD